MTRSTKQDMIDEGDDFARQLLKDAKALENDLDQKLAIMREYTRWLAVKHRIDTGDDEPDGITEYRRQLGTEAGDHPGRRPTGRPREPGARLETRPGSPNPSLYEPNGTSRAASGTFWGGPESRSGDAGGDLGPSGGEAPAPGGDRGGGGAGDDGNGKAHD